MLLPKINQKQALLAWHKLVQKKNAEMPSIERKRTLKDGTEQVFVTQAKLIPGNVEATGSRLIINYIRAYETSILQRFSSEDVAAFPSLFTNASKLADERTVSDRTIRNHISRLRQVGLICEYKFHGTHHDFELWISPEILFSQDENKYMKNNINAQETSEKSSPAAPERINFPLNVSHDTHDTLEKEISNVDKGVAPQQVAMPGGDGGCPQLATQNTGNTGPQQGAEIPVETAEAPLAATKQATRAGGAAAAQNAAKQALFKSYVEHFWSVACKLLYPGTFFNEYMQKQAKIAIWYGVYDGFRPERVNNLTDAEMEAIQGQMIERLKLAANYYENHPDKTPPLPYAQYVKGTGYFDRENTRGFRGTYHWLVKQQVWRHQQEVNRALSRAAKELDLHKKGKVEKLDKRLQGKTLVQLFKFHEEKIRKYGQPALDKFYAMHV